MNSITNKEVLKIISIADIHFGALDPQYQYTQLKAQFIDRLRNLVFDILEICGDLFDSKYMGNNPIISYTLLFIDENGTSEQIGQPLYVNGHNGVFEWTSTVRCFIGKDGKHYFLRLQNTSTPEETI